MIDNVAMSQRAVAALPHDAHFMGIVLTALNALSTVHPEQNPALAGQNIYKSKEIQDKQIVRLIGARASAAPLLACSFVCSSAGHPQARSLQQQLTWGANCCSGMCHQGRTSCIAVPDPEWEVLMFTI